jgi:hypothetical protein
MRNQNTPRKKLVLNKTTIQDLTTEALNRVHGGMIDQSVLTRCKKEGTCPSIYQC